MVRKETEHRHLAAILFVDMVGFSALRQSVALQCRQAMLALAAESLGGHRGSLLNTMGDGFLAEFPTALDALICAMELQESLRQRNEGQSAAQRFSLRAGLHVGEVVVQDGTIIGNAVNLAARIEPLAAPGGVALSEEVFRQVQGDLDLQFRRLGLVRVKNFTEPVCVYHLHGQGATTGQRVRHACQIRLRRLGALSRGVVVLGTVALLALAFWLLDLSWAESPKRRTDRAYELLKRYDLKANLDRAETLLSLTKSPQVPEQDPEHPRMLAGLAAAKWYRFLTEWDEEAKGAATNLCGQALDGNGNLVLAHLVRGWALQDEGRFDEAIAELQAASNFSKGRDATAVSSLAYAHAEKGDSAKAEELFGTLGTCKQPAWDAYNRLGRYHADRSDWPKSAAAFSDANSSAPGNYIVLANLGQALLMQSNSTALKVLQDSLTLRENAAAFHALGSYSMRIKDYTNAAWNYNRAVELSRSNYYVYLGDLGWARYHLEGQTQAMFAAFDLARRGAEAALSMRPANSRVRARIGLYQAGAGGEENVRLSRANREQAVREAPDNGEVLSKSAVAAILVGDTSRARELVKTMAELRQKRQPGP